MKLKTKTSIFSAKLVKSSLNLFGLGATSLPGKIALKIDSEVLKNFKNEYEFIFVTGTNGKTLTSHLITKVLKKGGYNILSNSSGSNMMQGLVTTLTTSKKTKKNKKNIAVLEVDEASVKEASKILQPKLIVINNIFRDQLDRYGEIYTAFEMIEKGIYESPNSTVLINADSPILTRGKYVNPVKYFGIKNTDVYSDITPPNNTDGILSPDDKSILHYHFMTYANLGDYYSTTNDFKRPELSYYADQITNLKPNSSEFEINNKISLKYPMGGIYNIYNALSAYSVGNIFNVPDEKIKEALSEKSELFGRQEEINYKNKEIIINLIKNPVGSNSIIDILQTDNQQFDLLTLINSNYADGIDTSWIWDVNFENLKDSNISDIYSGGERNKDIFTRLTMAGFDIKEDVGTDVDKIVKIIENSKSDKIYILATYTAMLDLRKKLSQKKIIQRSF